MSNWSNEHALSVFMLRCAAAITIIATIEAWPRLSRVMSIVTVQQSGQWNL